MTRKLLIAAVIITVMCGFTKPTSAQEHGSGSFSTFSNPLTKTGVWNVNVVQSAPNEFMVTVQSNGSLPATASLNELDFQFKNSSSASVPFQPVTFPYMGGSYTTPVGAVILGSVMDGWTYAGVGNTAKFTTVSNLLTGGWVFTGQFDFSNTVFKSITSLNVDGQMNGTLSPYGTVHYNGSTSPDIAITPEGASLALLLPGMLPLVIGLRRRNKTPAMP